MKPKTSEIQYMVRLNKAIAIVESCNTLGQFRVAKEFVELLEFETVGDCEKIKQVIIKKDKQLNTK